MLLQTQNNLSDLASSTGEYHAIEPKKEANKTQQATWMQNIILLMMICVPATSVANSYQSQSEIRDTARDFVQQQLENSDYHDAKITLNRLDSRLRLTPCTSALEAFLPSGQKLMGKITVGIKCAQPKPWSVYVPTKIDVYKDVLAASRTILRGQMVTPNDISIVRKKMSVRSRPFFHDINDLANMVARRNITVGKIFTPQLVQAPQLVHRGEEVILIAKTGKLIVRMTGRALNDGSRGDLIQVKNTSSNRIIEGIVTTQGVVKVKM